MRKAIVTRSNRSILIVKYKSPNKKNKVWIRKHSCNTKYYINADVMQ